MDRMEWALVLIWFGFCLLTLCGLYFDHKEKQFLADCLMVHKDNPSLCDVLK